MKIAIAVASVLSVTAGASATIVGANLGTGARPATLGGYTMQTFGDDTRPVFEDVGAVSPADGSPFGTIEFSDFVNHREIGSGWATWSGGYTGDVYYYGGGGKGEPEPGRGASFALTLFLPAGTGAFYLYAEPNPFEIFDITATANDGTSVGAAVDGDGGANGYGFYTDGLSTLSSITITSSIDFAVGEFAIAQIPAPGALALAGLAGLLGLRRRR